jgi:membrane-bound lytic murein transglycosylase A
VALEKDDLSRGSLEQAIRNSLLYYNRLPDNTQFDFGPQRVPVSRIKRSLETFLELLSESLTWDEIAEQVRDKFIIYRSTGRDAEQRVLFTGYYEPIIQGSLTPDDHYRYPLYGVPDDLLTIDLGNFNSRCQGQRLVGRLEGNRVVPYHSREEIDAGGRLLGKGFELVWLADPVDRFFLHIQGSGRIRLVNGDFLRVNYAGNNGHPYRSIGKYLIEEDQIPREVMSMQAIRRHLKNHSEQIPEVFNINPSYVFFRIEEEGPLGSIGVPITAGRSIATDPKFFPRGALAFIECEKPIFAEDGVIMGWTNFGRYVLNQDAGGAIKGPGRVDLFWGSGPYGRIGAGHFKHQGSLYFLLVRE